MQWVGVRVEQLGIALSGGFTTRVIQRDAQCAAIATDCKKGAVARRHCIDATRGFDFTDVLVGLDVHHADRGCRRDELHQHEALVVGEREVIDILKAANRLRRYDYFA